MCHFASIAQFFICVFSGKGGTADYNIKLEAPTPKTSIFENFSTQQNFQVQFQHKAFASFEQHSVHSRPTN